MKILLTGATGFLGTALLKLLVEDPRITGIVALSRKRDSHPDKKVQVLRLDLSEPGILGGLAPDPSTFDAIIHLAGAYDFNQDYAANYLNNTVAMTHLTTWLEEHGAQVPIHYASTYAVNAGIWAPERAEVPVDVLPPRSLPYALSKAQAERTLLAAKTPKVIYRLGILVGDTRDGWIDKIDGPYYILRLLTQVAETGVGRYLPILPLPALPKAFLPLVPVDAAARVLHAGLFMNLTAGNQNPIFGVFNQESLSVDTLIQAMLQHLRMRCRPIYLPSTPDMVAKFQRDFTGVPAAVFAFAKLPQHLYNPRFSKVFTENLIPTFETYRSQFFHGFEVLTGRTLA